MSENSHARYRVAVVEPPEGLFATRSGTSRCHVRIDHFLATTVIHAYRGLTKAVSPLGDNCGYNLGRFV